MPDTLSLTAGVSLGLLAGIVSGVCYLFANGYTQPRNERDSSKRRCITSKEHPICCRCGGDTVGGILPCICEDQGSIKFESGAWFLQQVERVLSLMPWTISAEKLEQIEEEENDSPEGSDARADLHNVREFLEAISARLAGGALEGTKVAPLYNHAAYLPQKRAGARTPAHPSSAASAHTQLKRLVARVVEEAAALPALARYAAEPHTPTESTTYEDLLATAILNKVIEKYQTENGSGGRSSGIHSASASPSPSDSSSPRPLNPRNIRDVTPPLNEAEDVSDWEEGEAADDVLEVPRRVPFPEFGGDIVHQTDAELRDFDDVSSSDIQAADGTWEENWLFQKKKINTIQSVPVPMLVPNSNTEYKALIGDRDADDTTDLSDNASETEDQEIVYKSDFQKVLDSKHVIGGVPEFDEEFEIEQIEPDSLMMESEAEDLKTIKYNEFIKNEDIFDSIEQDNTAKDFDNDNIKTIDNPEEGTNSILMIAVDSGPVPKAEFNLKEEIHRTMMNGYAEELQEDENTTEPVTMELIDKAETTDFSNKNETSNTLQSRYERESEYEETVTVPVQRYADSLRRKHFDDEPEGLSSLDHDEELIPGSIADRERKKWLNYVEMPNNPYSPDAIQKRLSAKSTSSLFDAITSNTEDNDDKLTSCEDSSRPESNLETDSLNDVDEKRHIRTSVSVDRLRHSRSESPSPRILRQVLSEENPQYKRYGRDYYIKEAKSSSGGRKNYSHSETSASSSIHKSASLDRFDTEFASPGLLIKQFNTIATNQQYTKFINKEQDNISITTMPVEYKNEILIEYEDANENSLFSAKPTYIDEETDRKFEEILKSAYSAETSQLTVSIDKVNEESEKSPISIENSLSTSSLEDTIKIYNVQTGEIVKCKPEDNVSPRYEVSDKNDNIDVTDKNISEKNDRLSETSDVDEDIVFVNILGEVENSLQAVTESEDLPTQLPSVKELARKFTSMESLSEHLKPTQHIMRRQKSKENILDMDKEKPVSKVNYMHSLTARSISKEFRDELKLSLATPITVPGGSKEIPEGTEEITKESSRPGSPLPEPGTLKSKLAFFEGLKSKFSNK